MLDIKRLVKDKQLVKDTLKQAPQKCNIPDEKQGINAEGFQKIMTYFCKQMVLDPPSEAELHLLFMEFNDKSADDNVFMPNQYTNFIDKFLQMLTAAQSSQM